MSNPENIIAWQRLTATITTSGRLEAHNIADLATLGVRQVINLALVDSPGALAEEADLLAQAGVAYCHIPVPFDAPEEAHYAAFITALESADTPLHVHCIANWRVSAFFYRYHRDHLGMPEAEARALMEQQWQPETSEDPRAKVWAEFIAPRPSSR